MSAPLLRPIDICDVCDELLPLVEITDSIKALKFKKIFVSNGVYARVHHECEQAWKESQEIA